MIAPRLLSPLYALLLMGVLLAGCASAPAGAARQEGFIRAPDGGPIYYEAEGKGPPVVLLHSAFSHSGMWEATMPALRGRRVVRFDARGHGRTPRASAPVLGADDLKLVMDALGIQRADLIGSSMGGAVAIDFALLAPTRVGRIVLSGSAPVGGSRPSPEETQPSLEIFAATRKRGLEAGVEEWANHPMNAAASPAVRERLRRLGRESPAIFSIGGFHEFPVTFLQPFAMTRTAELTQPILLIIGKRDLPTLQANARRAAAELPQGRLVELDDVGHFPSLEESGRFNRLIQRFLAGEQAGLEPAGKRADPP